VDPVTERFDVQNEDLLTHEDGSEPEKSLRLKGTRIVLKTIAYTNYKTTV